MANTWASIGRAQPHKYAGEILQNKMAIEQNERQALLAQSKLAMDAEQIERMRRQNALDAEAQQKAQTLHPVEEFHGYFRKGAESSNYKMVMDWAKQRGLINTDAGGLGAIREGDIPQVMEFMQNPMTLKNISRNVISDIDRDIASINSQLGEGDKKKDPNPKQQEALAQLNQEKLAALSVNANLVNHLKQQEQAEIAAKAAIEKERRDIAAAELEHTRKLEQIEANKTEDTKAPTLKTMKNKDGAWTYHQWDKATKQWIDTGMVSKTEGSGTGKERDIAVRIAKLPELQRRAKEDPEKLYTEGIKMNDDGTVYQNPITSAPEILQPFDKVLGKRGMTTAILKAGEQYDDAVELSNLLKDPEVAKNLKAAGNDPTIWDRAKGTFSNRVLKWMTTHGISKNTPTYTAITRMQRMASNERKAYLGTAVTEPELRSTLSWMPEANDSYDEMINKINLIVYEGKETFTRFLDTYKNNANMSPFYKAFGMKRFSHSPTESGMDKESKAAMLIKKYSKGQ